MYKFLELLSDVLKKPRTFLVFLLFIFLNFTNNSTIFLNKYENHWINKFLLKFKKDKKLKKLFEVQFIFDYYSSIIIIHI